MINALKPPTDNLYKFIAIAGLVGCVLAVYIDSRRVDAVITAYAPALGAAQDLWFATEELKPLQDLLQEYWKQASEGSTGFGFTHQTRKIEGVTPQFAHDMKLHELKIEEFAQQIQQRKVRRHEIRLLFGISFGVMLVGFLLWYFKTQAHQDAILRDQAAASRTAVAGHPPPPEPAETGDKAP